jgi:hypothetical protein
MNSDGQQEEKKVCLRTNDKEHADTNNREKEIGYCDRETTMVSNGKHTLSVIEK